MILRYPLAVLETDAQIALRLRIAIVGGLLVSQMLTLYTTPVIYLFFDRLARRFKSAPIEGEEDEETPELVPAD